MVKYSFNNKDKFFYNELKQKVDAYFKENNLKQTGNNSLHLKAILLISTAVFTYIFLLTAQYQAIIGIGLSCFLGLVLASIGFNIMHDACHGSYSDKKWVNEILGLSLNALGGNMFIWKMKHNIVHHTYTNVDGLDDDIAKSPLIRQCTTQKWKPAHKFQHLYVFLLYAISSFAWVFIMDFNKYFSRKINNTPLQKMSFKEHSIFWFSKLMYLVFYVALPIILVGLKNWGTGFACMHVFFGLTMSIVFQLAHVVEETEFESVAKEGGYFENEWAIHQVKTTANFGPHNNFLSWFVGGLNFQIEHHLFPRISHIHYPAISKIVQESCQKHQIKYAVFETMSNAIASHFRFMRELGKKPSLTKYL